jgi:hypothetical protein
MMCNGPSSFASFASFAVVVVIALGGLSACATMENAAKRDPLKCERDPKCTEKSRAADCSRQCSDDPSCVDRCREMNVSSGAQDR